MSCTIRQPSKASTYVSGNVVNRELAIRRGQLRPYFHRCSIRYKIPKLIHLGICHRNATVRPINHALRRTEPSQTVPYAVNHDVATRVYSKFTSTLPVGVVWVGNVKSTIESAVRVSVIDLVQPLGV